MLLRYWVRPLAHRFVAVFSSMLQCVAVCCSVLQCVAVCCSVLQCVTVFSSMLQSVAVCFRGWGCCDIFYRALLQKRPVKEPCSFAKEPCKPYYLKEPTWVRPYAHKFVALCCSMLQRIGVAVCLRGRVCYATGSDLRHSGLLRCVAVCCSVLQRVSVAVCFRGGVAQARQNFGTYGVATISMLLQITGLFCRIQSLLQGSFAKQTYNLKEPTNRSHPIGLLQYVAVYCSVLYCGPAIQHSKCVAVCCSVLQCVALCCSVLQYVAVYCIAVQQ